LKRAKVIVSSVHIRDHLGTDEAKRLLKKIQLAGGVAGLLAGRRRYHLRALEEGEVELFEALAIDARHAQLFRGLGKAVADQVGLDALPVHALGEIAVVLFAAAHFADAVHHALRTVGEMCASPEQKNIATEAYRLLST
jgi:hypothetical protein